MATKEFKSHRTRHIAVKDYYLCSLAKQKLIAPEYVPTTENPADQFTKPLMDSAFVRHRNNVLGEDPAHDQFNKSTPLRPTLGSK